MIEVVLAVLLAAVSGVGAVLWRKANQTDAEARRLVDQWRDEARQANSDREATIVANVESIDKRVGAIDDDREGRQQLADMLNRD